MDNFTLKETIENSGKVSLGNTKMPSTTFAISAKHCKVGSKLAKIEGSTCSRSVTLLNFKSLDLALIKAGLIIYLRLKN